MQIFFCLALNVAMLLAVGDETTLVLGLLADAAGVVWGIRHSRTAGDSVDRLNL